MQIKKFCVILQVMHLFLPAHQLGKVTVHPGKEGSTRLFAEKRVNRFVAILCVYRLYGFCFLPCFLRYRMTLYMTSDLHVDHYAENRTEISSFIERYLPSCDVLCVAGDTADNPKIFIDFYRLASLKYRHIFLTFGNHDLTVKHDDSFLSNPFTQTEEKLKWLKEKLSELPDIW